MGYLRYSGISLRKIGFMAFTGLLLVACSGEGPPLPGERFTIRPTTATEVENRSAAIALPAAVNLSEWTHENGNTAHSQNNAAVSTTPSLRWSTDIGVGVNRNARLSNGPVSGGGLVYVFDGEGQISAVTADGAIVWSLDSAPTAEQGDDGAGGGLSYANGTLYAATGYGEILAISATNGAIAWRRSFEAPFQSAPTILGDLVMVVTRTDQAYGLNAKDGSTEWTHRGHAASSGGFDNAASPAAVNGFAILPFSSGDMIAVEPRTGQPRWREALDQSLPSTALGRFGEISGDPVIAGGNVYAANVSGQTVKMNLTTGARVWAISAGAVDPVVPVGGSVFLMTARAELVRVNASNGEVIWVQSLPAYDNPEKRKGVIRYYGPVLGGGLMWVTSRDGHLRGFAPDSGSLVSDIAVPGGAASAPIIVGGIMYILSLNGNLHAFQ